MHHRLHVLPLNRNNMPSARTTIAPSRAATYKATPNELVCHRTTQKETIDRNVDLIAHNRRRARSRRCSVARPIAALLLFKCRRKHQHNRRTTIRVMTTCHENGMGIRRESGAGAMLSRSQTMQRAKLHRRITLGRSEHHRAWKRLRIERRLNDRLNDKLSDRLNDRWSE